MHNAPFTLQAVCPTATGVNRWWNCLPGHPIPTGTVTCGYRHLAKCPCPATTPRNLYATLCYSGEMSMYLHSPYVTVLHRKTTESQP